VIHFGLVPRSHRGIFVINELPDLQPRIQVALFNILQEGDIQIRGFKLRLPLDIEFVFTANPEDYTNRGSIVTPLKDRIQSQILTHYPKSTELSKSITRQEARIHPEQHASVEVPELAEDLVEQIAFEARQSEYVDSKSGVSARLTISAYESMVSAAERRALRNGEDKTFMRISDFWGVVPAITGKIELVYEGEQEGPANVAQILVGKAIRTLFTTIFPDPDKAKKSKNNTYQQITEWFGRGNTIDVLNDATKQEYKDTLDGVPGLADLVGFIRPDAKGDLHYFLMEFVLHGLAEYSLIGKSRLERGTEFSDLLSGMFEMQDFEEEED
jgi:magnesium chelatase subunit I